MRWNHAKLKQLFDRSRTARRRTRRSQGASAEVLETRTLLSATLWVDHASPSSFQTIQSAVNAAHAGDTIKVAPGIYSESVTVPLGVTVLGGQIHLRGEKGPSIVESDTVGFTLEANNIAIEGFTVEPATLAGNLVTVGIETDTGTHSGDSILDNVITSCDVGIFVQGSTTGVTICGNQVENGGDYGIEVLSSGDTVSDNTVEFIQDLATTGTGIEVNTTGSATIIGNTVTESETDGILAFAGTTLCVSGNTSNQNTTAGIAVDDLTGTVTLSSNRANNNQQGITAASDAATLNGNTADSNLQDGFVLDLTSATLIKNTANSNGQLGIELLYGTATLTGNTANSNLGAGMEVIDGTSLSMSGNTANSNALGILASCATGTFTGNTANNNTGDGLLGSASTSATLQSNTADGDVQGLNYGGPAITLSGNTTDKDQVGVELIATAGTVTNNTADNNALDGFNVDVSSGTISGNTADSNRGAASGQGAGFLINGSPTTVKNNTANNNLGDGFQLANVTGATFSSNTANSNDNDGIHLEFADGNTFTGNTTDGNLNDGIEVSSASTGNTLNHNTALKNTTWDLQDESTGAGTDGTGNTWTNNTAVKTTPAGL